jgi:hypothetical protein
MEVDTAISLVRDRSSSVEGTPNVEGPSNVERSSNVEKARQTCTTEDGDVYVEVRGERCGRCTKRDFVCLRWDRGEKPSRSCWRCGVYGDKQACSFVGGEAKRRPRRRGGEGSKGKAKATVTTDAERLEVLEEKLDEVLQHVRMQTDAVDALVEGMTNLRGKVAQMESTIAEKLSYEESDNE